MLDGRRHSVDIPLSKALVALRRVRSLRDPTTNSMSKFSSFVDNLTWETESFNGISLQMVNGYDNEIPARIRDYGLDGRRVGSHSDPELDCSLTRPDSKLVSSENLASLEKRRFDSKKKKTGNGACRSNLFDERLENDHREKKLDLTYLPPSNNHNESVAANMGNFETSVQKLKSRHDRRIRSPGEVRGDAGSRVGSPYPSVSDGQIDGSSRSASLFADEDEHIAGYSNCGCGINSCWSRTPRFRESSLPSDVEDHPLLSEEGGETNPFEREISCTYAKNEITPHKGSSRSLSHKFRPRSFSELVGQNVVARSLLNAILRGKITSFYLFHGPRGTGKTSASRIFAAALNCLSLEERRPCGLCRECMLFSCGRSRDIKEVDPVRTNRMDKLRLLLKNAANPPVSSQFKVFIIDECQLLQGETWATLLNSLDELPRHVVFVMITADLDGLPRSAVSRCQRYHFLKIKDADIVSRLSRICLEEGWEFDKVALDFIAAKSNGSLRDAEMILDQLSLLGKRITISLAHELIGIVSNEELLDLLDLALSSDTSTTVRRARELMRSRVDPMQLISQLANLIMDILAGRCQTGASKTKRFRRQTSEADLQKLRNVLKALSEIEKQLRTSRNQSTWLTVALLQLSSVDSSSLDSNDSRTCLRKHPDNGLHDTSTCGERLKRPVSCLVTGTKSQDLEIHRYSGRKLETIWRGAIENCGSRRLKNFLLREGKLSSISVHHDLAVVEVEFCHPDHVSRAEKSWKLIASSLQLVLGCSVEIRIKLEPCARTRKNMKMKKPCFGLLNCSRRMLSTSDNGIDKSKYSDFTSARAIIGEEKPVETCSIDHCEEVDAIVRKKKGHDESNGNRDDISLQHDSRKRSPLGAHSSEVEGINQEIQVLSIQDPQIAARAQRRLHSPDASHKICLRIQPQDKFDLASPQKKPFETYFCASDPYILCSSSNTLGNSSRNEDLRQGKESELDLRAHCWKAPKFTIRKGWQLRPQQQRCQLTGWILPCATAK